MRIDVNNWAYNDGCFEPQYDYERVKKLSKRLIDKITSELTHVVINGDPDRTYPGCVNMSFAFVEGESLLMACKNIALSSGRYDWHELDNDRHKYRRSCFESKCLHVGLARAELCAACDWR